MILDKEQTAAASHYKGPLLLLAGPGSGKTTVLTARIFNLIRNFKEQPSSILVLTFTKEAALSMQKKFIKISRGNIDGYSDVTFGTFHSVFLHILLSDRKHKDYRIVSGSDKMNLLKEAVLVCHIDYSVSAESLDRLSGDISFTKNTGDFSFEKSSALSENDFKKVFTEYEEKKERLGLFDFDDMLTETMKLFSSDETLLSKVKERYNFILVDEAQDMNKLQFDIISKISGFEKNVFMVGDDDQSIYGFRGADPSYMLDFKKFFPEGKIFYLNSNYRCAKIVVERSLNLISYNKNRFKKNLVSKSKIDGEITYHLFDDDEKESYFALDEIKKSKETHESVAVLVRHRVDGEKLNSLLMKEKIDFFSGIKKASVKEKGFIDDLVSYFRLSNGELNREDLLRIINAPNRGIPRRGIEDEIVDRDKWLSYFEKDISIQNKIMTFLADIDFLKTLSPVAQYSFICTKMGYKKYALETYGKNIDSSEINREIDDFLDSLKKYKKIRDFLSDYDDRKKETENASSEKAKPKENENVFLYTFHGSKGLEFDKVIILSVNDGIVPSNKAVTEKDREEERRMFYVALTRAKKSVMISCVKKRGSKELLPSIYLKETLKMRGEE